MGLSLTNWIQREFAVCVRARLCVCVRVRMRVRMRVRVRFCVSGCVFVCVRARCVAFTGVLWCTSRSQRDSGP